MISSKIDITKSSDSTILTIYIEKSPLIVRLIIGAFSIIGFLIPIVVVIFSIITELGIGLEFILVIILGLGVGVYFARLVLWNTYGKEQLEISKKGIKYHCDYKFFKDNLRFLDYSELSIEAASVDCCENNKTTNPGSGIIIKNDTAYIETCIRLVSPLISETIEKINQAIKELKQKV